MPFPRPLTLSCLLLALTPASLPGQSAAAPAPAPAASAPAAAAPAKPQPAYLNDPKFVEAFNDAKTLEKKHQYVFALDGYKKANKIAGGSCRDCLQKMYQIQLGEHSYKEAIASAEQLKALATAPVERSVAQTDLGNALLAEGGDKPKPPQLDAAHAAYQAALTDYPKNLNARYHDACVLARMGKNEDASKEFAACAEAAPATDPMRVRARHFAEEPALSMSKMAPAFEVTALDGTRFNLDNMGGKVVLIDFWATWCGPCNAELPHMKKIAKEFANEPLVIISISWDSDAQKWKDFIAKNEMTWLQYRDADHSLSERFGINAIPHYFTIDSDGVLTAEMMGSGSDVEGKLKKLIKRAREAEQMHPVEKAENKTP
jgi:thiol-disulfide isomerase/thioredoxin